MNQLPHTSGWLKSTDWMERAVHRSWKLATLLAMFGASVGCNRELTIIQHDRINNGMHINRPENQRTGEPLEVNIVCVKASDLDEEGNSLLDPDSGITCDLWYRDRPAPGAKIDDEDYSGFKIPKSQVFVLTDEKDRYGSRQGAALRGAVADNRSKVEVSFDFGGELHAKKSVIYVFPKFMGPDGTVLPVTPAKFSPPGDFVEELTVEIGVDNSRPHYGQFVERTTEAKLNRSKHEE